MNLCPTPTWRTPLRQGSRILLGALLLACGEAPRAVDAAATTPTVASAPPPVSTAPPPSAAPASQAPATLFAGQAPTVPPAFEGLAPGMPMLAAKVLFPSLNRTQILPSRVANLRLQVLGDTERVTGLLIKSLDPQAAPSGADLRALATARWGEGIASKDDSGQRLTFWHAPGLRACHRQNLDGTGEILFDAWQPIAAFIDAPLTRLRGLLGKPLSAARAAFEHHADRAPDLELIFPATRFGDPITAVLTPDASGAVKQIVVNVSFAQRPAAKAELFAVFEKAWGKPRAVEVDGYAAQRFGRIDVEEKADKWRLILR